MGRKFKYNSSSYTEDQLYHYKLYKFFVENRLMSYSKFKEKLCLSMNISDISISQIRSKIDYVTKYIYPLFGEQMQLILDYKLARVENDRVNALLLYSKIKDIETESPSIMLRKTQSIMLKNPMQSEKIKENFQKLKEKRNREIDIVINENKPINELLEEGKIENKNLYANIFLSARDIDTEKFIKLVKINTKIKSISYTELDQIIETLDFFCKNLEESAKKLDLFQTEDEIKNLYVEGQEKLIGKYKTEISLLKKWKKERIKGRIKYYKIFRDFITDFKNNKNPESIFPLDQNTKRNVKESIPYLYDYYIDIMKLAGEYRKICNINSATDSKKEEIKNEFMKQLILRDNE